MHPLSMRPDRGGWVIGRIDTGEFIQVPEVAHQILLLLRTRHTVQEVSDMIRADEADPVDVAGFVEDLIDLGFVEAIDDHAIRQPDPPTPSLPWLKVNHTRWLLHPRTAAAASVIIVAAIGCIAARPAVVPTYHSLVWSRWGGLVVAGNAAIAWTLIFLHELGHLAAARGAGVPARLSLGTRLQFLAAQTDVTGVWAMTRRIRLTVYLAGVVVNLVVASLGLITLAIAGNGMPATADRIISVTTLMSVLYVPLELCIFMRTDIYFVLQDLAGCTSLYADGSDYLRYLLRRAGHLVRPNASKPADPSLCLAGRERQAVRLYTIMLPIGTAACLAVAFTTELPAAALLLARALGDLASVSSPARVSNGLAVVATTGGSLGLWARAWWRRHGQRLRHLLENHLRQRKGGDVPREDQDPQARED